MNRWLTWGEAIWPGRWERVIGSHDFNLLPWRRMRQGLEWGAWSLGILIGGIMGASLGHLRTQSQAHQALHWQSQSQGLRSQLHESQTRLSHWQQRWAWQTRQEALQAWRAQGLHGLIQPLMAPPGEALIRSLSWDDHHAQAELWVVHPDLASPWLESHWKPWPDSPWQAQGEWRPIRRESGEAGGIGTTVWSGQWQSQGPVSLRRPS